MKAIRSATARSLAKCAAPGKWTVGCAALLLRLPILILYKLETVPLLVCLALIYILGMKCEFNITLAFEKIGYFCGVRDFLDTLVYI